jgi:hypothetical protein
MRPILLISFLRRSSGNLPELDEASATFGAPSRSRLPVLGPFAPTAPVFPFYGAAGVLVAEDMFDELFCVFADFEARNFLVRRCVLRRIGRPQN